MSLTRGRARPPAYVWRGRGARSAPSITGNAASGTCARSRRGTVANASQMNTRDQPASFAGAARRVTNGSRPPPGYATASGVLPVQNRNAGP